MVNARVDEYACGDPHFAEWLTEVDNMVQQTVMMSVFDLADTLLRDSFDAGDSPKEALLGTVVEGVRDEYGSGFATHFQKRVVAAMGE